MDLAQSAEAGTPVVGRDRPSAAIDGHCAEFSQGNSNGGYTPATDLWLPIVPLVSLAEAEGDERTADDRVRAVSENGPNQW